MDNGERAEATAATTSSAEAGAATAAPSTDPGHTAAPPGARAHQRRPSGASSASITEEETFRIECLMNARYHSSREAFLDTVHRWFMFGIIVLGAAAIVDVLPSSELHHWKAVFGAGAAILGALDLTFDLSNRARIHSLMKRRYFELMADAVEKQKPQHTLTACLHRFYADEEPAYHALLALSWNAAQEMVYGDDALSYVVPWYHRWFKNFIRYGGTKYSLQRRANLLMRVAEFLRRRWRLRARWRKTLNKRIDP